MNGQLTIKHSLDGHWAKGRNENPVCLSPVVFIFRLCSKETLRASGLPCVQCSRRNFPEASLITELVEQIEAANYDSLLAANCEFVDGAVDVGEPFESMQWHLILQIEKIPDQRVGRGAGNGRHMAGTEDMGEQSVKDTQGVEFTHERSRSDDGKKESIK